MMTGHGCATLSGNAVTDFETVKSGFTRKWVCEKSQTPP